MKRQCWVVMAQSRMRYQPDNYPDFVCVSKKVAEYHLHRLGYERVPGSGDNWEHLETGDLRWLCKVPFSPASASLRVWLRYG